MTFTLLRISGGVKFNWVMGMNYETTLSDYAKFFERRENSHESNRLIAVNSAINCIQLKLLKLFFVPENSNFFCFFKNLSISTKKRYTNNNIPTDKLIVWKQCNY